MADDDRAIASTSGVQARPRPMGRAEQPPLTADHRTQQLLQQAEMSKAKIFQAPGENLQLDTSPNGHFSCKLSKELAHSVMVDEKYLMIGTHLDDTTNLKIIKGDYVEFEKLLPRDKIAAIEDQRMQIVNRGNQTFWVPIKESHGSIHNFHKWEQAFQVFTNVHIQSHPNRAAELVQYSHLIYTASLSFVWDNVYNYDKDFRLHLSHFPNRSWAIILQQAWSIRLKDKL